MQVFTPARACFGFWIGGDVHIYSSIVVVSDQGVAFDIYLSNAA
jgi:hypothetical protein